MISIMLPLQFQRIFTQTQLTIFSPTNPNNPSLQHSTPPPTSNKTTINKIMSWLYSNCLKSTFSEPHPNQNQKISSTLQQIFITIIRWSVTSYTKSLQLRAYLLEWVFYSIGQYCTNNQSILRSCKQAFFSELMYYSNVVLCVNINKSKQLSVSVTQENIANMINYMVMPCMQFLDYFAFYSPGVADMLFGYLFTSFNPVYTNPRQPHSFINSLLTQNPSFNPSQLQQKLRPHINMILKTAINHNIFHINEILSSQSNCYLNNGIKNQLYYRINQQWQKNELGLNLGQYLTGNKHIHQKYQSSFKQKQKYTQNYPKPYEKYEKSQDHTLKYQHSQTSSYTNPTLNQRFSNLFSFEQQYYGTSKIGQQNSGNYNQNMKMFEQDDQDDDEVIYSSHEDIIINDNVMSQCEKNSETNKIIQQKSSKYQQNPQSSHPSSPPLPLCPQSYPIYFQKQFLQQMSPSISQLFTCPTISTFTQFVKTLIKLLKQYKKSNNQQQIIDNFLQQTAKVIYLAFNRQFQTFCEEINEEYKNNQENNQNKSGKQKQSGNINTNHSLPYFLLKSIHQYWKQSLTIYNIYIYKKIIKILCQAFPSCQFTFYYVFLDIFRKGVPNFKQMKMWLFDKEKEKHIIDILRKVKGKQFKIQIYENAQCLKIVNG